jgi:hypothetical protein
VRAHLLRVLIAALAVHVTASSADAAVRRPVGGDWEGPGASLVLARGHGTRVRQLAVAAPLCFTASTPVQHIRSPQGPIAATVHTGRFLARKRGVVVVVGTFASRRSLTLTVSSLQPGCSDSLRIRLRPGHRLALDDGVWQGVASDGEPVYFDVAAGGRLLVHRPTKAYGIPKYIGIVGVGAITCSDPQKQCGTVGPCAGEVQGSNWFIPASGPSHLVNRTTTTSIDQSGNTTIRHDIDEVKLTFSDPQTATGTWMTTHPDAFGQDNFDDPPPPAPCSVTFTAAAAVHA